MSKINDITGQRFGKLIVICLSNNRMHGKLSYDCICDCGQSKSISGNSLIQGKTKSCGCLQKEHPNGLRHGFATQKNRLREYNIWQGMKTRCYTKSSTSYHNYGALGITVCKEWLNDFPKFLSDMGKCPSGYSIDRIDSTKGYYKENCRWATRIEQNNNARSNRNITYNGQTKTLINWARELNIRYRLLYYRIVTKKWGIKRAFDEKT